jgi:hypothetical protein
MQLQASRQIGMQPNHISYQEIACWSQLLNIQVTQFEVRCLMALDSCYLNHSEKVRASKAPKPTNT